MHWGPTAEPPTAIKPPGRVLIVTQHSLTGIPVKSDFHFLKLQVFICILTTIVLG